MLITYFNLSLIVIKLNLKVISLRGIITVLTPINVAAFNGALAFFFVSDAVFNQWLRLCQDLLR